MDDVNMAKRFSQEPICPLLVPEGMQSLIMLVKSLHIRPTIICMPRELLGSSLSPVYWKNKLLNPKSQGNCQLEEQD